MLMDPSVPLILPMASNLDPSDTKPIPDTEPLGKDRSNFGCANVAPYVMELIEYNFVPFTSSTTVSPPAAATAGSCG